MFKKFIPAICAILGLKSFNEENGRKILTAQQKAQLISYNFPEQFVEDFEASLNEEPVKDSEDTESRTSILAALVSQNARTITELTAERDALKAGAKASADQLAECDSKIAELTRKISAMAEMAEPDTKKVPGNPQALDLADDKQLGGIQGAMFALDRPYNQRARQALAKREGVLYAAADYGADDYQTLRDDLGAFYRVPWSTRLQSFLTVLPTLEKIFPLESGYQDLATVANVWLGEFSQPANTVGSNFDDVVKGKYDFGQETLRMFSVMFVHKFQDLSAIEKLWIGFLNREGSDPVKMSFIEYLLVETAKKLHNERELRRVNGIRKDPNPNKPGRAMEAADGLYEFVRKKVDGFVDITPDSKSIGKTVYQIKPFDLPEITPGNIGEVLYQGTSMIPSHIRDTGNVVCYIPSWMVPLYNKYNEAHYGTNQDYKPNLMCVKEFPSVKLEPVMNADGHSRVIWTLDGNIKLFEDKPGEMLAFKLEVVDWSVKVYSVWKESVWAIAVGYKYTDPSQMDGSRQLIWCTPYDFTETTFVESEPNTNPSAKIHTSIKTAKNDAELEITDIVDAKVGTVVMLQCGADGEHGVVIKKKGKFALISSDWTPSKGDTISLMKRAGGDFVEIGRTTGPSDTYMFPSDETAPSVADATVFVVGENTQATALTTLKDAETGVLYTIHGNGTENATTIAKGGNFVLSKDIILKSGALIKLVKSGDGKFYEITRVEAAAE